MTKPTLSVTIVSSVARRSTRIALLASANQTVIEALYQRVVRASRRANKGAVRGADVGVTVVLDARGQVGGVLWHRHATVSEPSEVLGFYCRRGFAGQRTALLAAAVEEIGAQGVLTIKSKAAVALKLPAGGLRKLGFVAPSSGEVIRPWVSPNRREAMVKSGRKFEWEGRTWAPIPVACAA